MQHNLTTKKERKRRRRHVVCYGKCTKKHMNRVGNGHLHYNFDLMFKNHGCLQVVDAFQVGKRGGDGSFK